MSRVGKKPVMVPKGVEIAIQGQAVSVKGKKGELQFTLHQEVSISQEGEVVNIKPRSNNKSANALSGTTRAIIQNMVTGVSDGYQKKLLLVGVGYRAQVQGKDLNLTLGFSHPVKYSIPDGITIESPSQSEIVVSGPDKQKVGQVSAEIRAYRPPEPYKGKGVKYADEIIARKDAKKK